MAVGAQTLEAFLSALAARQPAPGGGAAAAVAAAIACASGAMAARYTTGERWAERSAEATALAETLDLAARELTALADEDAAAYAAVQAARKAKDTAAQSAAEAEAMAVPVRLLAGCARHAEALAAFSPRCNPHLVSDVEVALHLLAGAARAAWRTLLVNRPTPALEQAGAADLARCTAAEPALR
jgi:formiminotetrahydrofolate cyclodeaminase